MTKNMAKRKAVDGSGRNNTPSLTMSKNAVDPALASLFASSAGPVRVPERKLSAVNTASQDKTNTAPSDLATEPAGNSSDTNSSANSDAEPAEERAQPPRKRRKVKTDDDLETSYLNKLVREEEKESRIRQQGHNSVKDQETRGGNARSSSGNKQDEDDNDSGSDSSASNDLQDLSDFDEVPPTIVLPTHESLTSTETLENQNRRTVFVSNVANSAIKTKSDRKAFIAHFKAALLPQEKERIESLRFRSTAYDVSAGPKKAAFAKKELMDTTTRSTHAYIVLSSEAAARRVATKLNGSQVLNRHIHVDCFYNRNSTDNKRCVFVGNLPFVDEETAAQDSADEQEDGDDSKKRKRPKAKLPADAEEGLWRTFSACGKVENVRLVRDSKTRVGKGFGYVQFEDGNAVEKALLLDGKKFPPLLPRLLRVSRIKGRPKPKQSAMGKVAPRPNYKVTNSEFRPRTERKGKMDGMVFEGYRASSDNKMKFKAKGRSKSKNQKDGVRPTSRSSKRGAVFKATGGKKKRDSK